MEDKKKRIEALVEQLNKASSVYYNGQDEIMSNYEWDALFDELASLWKKRPAMFPGEPDTESGLRGRSKWREGTA